MPLETHNTERIMTNQTANIALLVAALLDMIVLLVGDITAPRDNGHNNSRYYAWLSKSGELLMAFTTAGTPSLFLLKSIRRSLRL